MASGATRSDLNIQLRPMCSALSFCRVSSGEKRSRGLAMTEAEWLAGTNPTPMLEFLEGKTSERKFRLFAVACCKRIRHRLSDPTFFRAIEVAEQYVDGRASGEEC